MSGDHLLDAARALRAAAEALDAAAREEQSRSPDRFLSVASVAELLDTTPARVHKLTSSGDLPVAVRDGRRPLYDGDDVVAYLRGEL